MNLLLDELHNLISEGNKVKKHTYQGIVGEYCYKQEFECWKSNVLTVLGHFELENTRYYKVIDQIHDNAIENTTVEIVLNQLKGLIAQVEKGFVLSNAASCVATMADLENIFNKFARVARQLRTRHDNRETLTIKDEYDVQDLLHALLVLHFDDVRDEEWTPSYAGGCERMDFLLKDLQTVIEVKKTRPSMSKKELGEELIVDIEKYKAHPDCKLLYCFVYDPDGYLGNSIGIKNDLEKNHDGFVKIFIKPEI